MSKFKVGDRVVDLTLINDFRGATVESKFYSGSIDEIEYNDNGTVKYYRIKADDKENFVSWENELELEEIWNSPLAQSMRETNEV